MSYQDFLRSWHEAFAEKHKDKPKLKRYALREEDYYLPWFIRVSRYSKQDRQIDNRIMRRRWKLFCLQAMQRPGILPKYPKKCNHWDCCKW